MRKVVLWWSRFVAMLVIGAGSQAALAQIPVTDVASLTQQIQQVVAWGQQYQQMVDSLQKYKTQIDNQVKQIQAITGGRGMGQLLTNMVQQQLPSDFLAMADTLRNQGAGGATPEATAIYDAIRTFDCAARFVQNMGSRRNCEASALAIPQNIALLNQSVQSAKQRQAQLKSFAASIDTTTDAKAAQDLANRLALEVAYLQNEKLMMDIATQQMEKQRMLTEQQSVEQGLQRMTTSSGGGSNPFGGGL